MGVYQDKLRFFRAGGELVPTPEEVAYQEKQHAEQEKQRAEQEKQRSDRLAAKLQELGIDPDSI